MKVIKSLVRNLNGRGCVGGIGKGGRIMLRWILNSIQLWLDSGGSVDHGNETSGFRESAISISHGLCSGELVLQSFASHSWLLNIK